MNLKQFTEQLQTARSKSQAKSLLFSYLDQFGFRGYAFTYYSMHVKSSGELQFDCVSAALRHWHIHYLEQGYANVDRTLEEIYQLTFPVYWDVHQQLIQAKNIRERRVREESIEFGIDKGLSLPIHGPHGDFATLTLHQFKNQTCLRNYKSQQFEWLAAAQIFYHYIKKILRVSKPTQVPYHLTQREKQCLELTAKSWRVEQIAKELEITPRTVNFHIQRANKKLGSHNKYQSAYKLLNYLEKI